MARKNKDREEKKGLARFRSMPQAFVSEEVRGYKMSDVLADFARPFMEDASTLEEIAAVYSMAAIAWNLALLPLHERIRALMPTLQELPVEERLLFKEAIGEMIAHKERAFAEYRRPVIDFELIDQGERYHLTVLSEIVVDKTGGEAMGQTTEKD